MNGKWSLWLQSQENVVVAYEFRYDCSGRIGCYREKDCTSGVHHTPLGCREEGGREEREDMILTFTFNRALAQLQSGVNRGPSLSTTDPVIHQ